MPRLTSDHPVLAPHPELAHAREILSGYRPKTSAQETLKRRMLDFIARHPREAHSRTCLEGHLTASALVLSSDGRRALLTHHRKLGRWLQVGGHCDGDANLAAVALKEAEEESGISGLVIDPRPVDLDIHPIPARPGEPRHLHFDTRFLIWAPEGAEPRGNHESHEVRWFDLESDEATELEDSIARLFELARVSGNAF